MVLNRDSSVRIVSFRSVWNGRSALSQQDNLHENPSPADDPSFSRVLLQPSGELCANETHTASLPRNGCCILGLSGEDSQVWRAGCSSLTAGSTGIFTRDTSHKIYDASLPRCLSTLLVPSFTNFETKSSLQSLCLVQLFGLTT